jgi:broad specificity phosphatase PhoE
MSLQLYLVRHGELPWPLSRQHTSWRDISLTAHGEAAARPIALRLQKVPFLVSVKVMRDMDPNELALSSQLAYTFYPFDEDYRPDQSLPWLRTGEACPATTEILDTPLSSETPAQVSQRADELVAHLRTLDAPIALSSHEHFGRVLAARWIGLPIEQAPHFLLDTTSTSTLAYEHNQPVVALWNRGGASG